MKFAYLILAHSNAALLEKFIDTIYSDNTMIYIHIDLKSDISTFKKCIKHNNVHFITNRHNVNWGGFSMVKATIELLNSYLLSNYNADYIHLCSGSDRQIVDSIDVCNFFERNRGNNFINNFSIPYINWNNSCDRFDYIWKIDELGFNYAAKFVVIQKSAERTRTLPKNIKLYGGSQWWSITHKCAEFIVNNSFDGDKLYDFFKNVFIPDESYFQTLLLNSKFKNSIINDNLRYIDMSLRGAHPRILNESDRPRYEKSGKFWARKFE